MQVLRHVMGNRPNGTIDDCWATTGEAHSACTVLILINAEPGSLITGRARRFCRAWRNQQEFTVKGIHFIQEDAPHEIGAALRGSLSR